MFDMNSSNDQVLQKRAVVKWFNFAKGFGFVAQEDGGQDAFLHASVVTRMGLKDLGEGTELLVKVSMGAKGPQVVDIVEVLGVVAIPSSGRPAPTGPVEELTGTIKWFKPNKGFGFATPDDGGRDVFVHRSILAQAGIQLVDSGQKVRMKVQTAAKGREAVEIELI